jgi:predicted dienelactone hydrolase
MKVFIDNDIAVKLAQWGLLKRFTQHLTKQGGADLYMVSTLKYRFRLAEPAKAAALLGSAAAVKQLTDFVAICKPARGYNAAVAAALTDIPFVDAGEATLFAAAAHFDAALIDTGDKKAMCAVGNFGDTHLVTESLAGKIACLEQTMHYLVERWTYPEVSKAVLSAPSADKSTYKCFNGLLQPAALTALHAKVEELRPHCAGTLSQAPFVWIT